MATCNPSLIVILTISFLFFFQSQSRNSSKQKQFGSSMADDRAPNAVQALQ